MMRPHCSALAATAAAAAILISAPASIAYAGTSPSPGGPSAPGAPGSSAPGSPGSPQTPGIHATDRDNLLYAARTEAAAHLQYTGYASVRSARGGGLAGVWRTVGHVEEQDHFGHTVDMAKLFTNDPAHDLQVAITAYRQTIADEQAILSRAPKGADVSPLRAVVDRHRGNLALLQRAQRALRNGGSMPAPPKVGVVAVRQSAKPKFSGTFYTTDLTGDAHSALADIAWNALMDERVARTAVDNGQASLARLMSGLRYQEEAQNWPSVANMAGYVDGTAADLKASIAGEKGAIAMYGRFAGKATDPAVAEAFKEYRADEEGHLKAFTYELDHL